MFENDFDSDMSGAGFTVSQTGAAGGATDKKGHARSSRLAPVKVSDLHEMLPVQDNVRIGSDHFSCVCIVGILRRVSRSGVSIFYEIDDMSGPPITVRYYSGEAEEMEVPMENTYVRVFGSIKTFEGKTSLMVFRVLPVEDLNELTVHLLEVAQCRLFYEKNALNSVGSKPAAGATYGDISRKANVSAAPLRVQNPVSGPPAPATTGGLGSTSVGADQVYDYLKRSNLENGVSIQELKRVFRNFNEHQVVSYLDFLCSEGQIYTTVDDEHFKVTD